MADMDNTSPDDEAGSKPFAIPAVAGVVGAAGGGLAAAHLMHRPGEGFDKKLAEAVKAETEAQTKYDTAKTTLLNDAANKALHDAHEAAEAAHNSAKVDHILARNEAWTAELGTASREVQTKVGKAVNDAMLKAIKAGPNGPAKDWALKLAEETETALKAEMAKSEFTNLTEPSAIKAAMEKITTDTRIAFTQKNPMPSNEALEAFGEHMIQYEEKNPTFLQDAMDKAAPDLAKKVEEATKTEREAVAAAAKELEEKGKPWLDKLEAATKAEKPALDAAKKTTGVLNDIKVINAEKGFGAVMMRPWNLLKKGGIGTKFGIVATGVAMGAAVFFGGRALLAPKQDSSSYVEREQQRTASRGAEPSPGVA